MEVVKSNPNGITFCHWEFTIEARLTYTYVILTDLYLALIGFSVNHIHCARHTGCIIVT